jgi:hypothetical protein
MKYRPGTDRDLRQIASALGAANVLDGTVRRDGNHARVSTELIDARNDHTIWADSHSYPLGKRYRHRTLNLTGSADYCESFADGRRTLRLADVLGFWKLGT